MMRIVVVSLRKKLIEEELLAAGFQLDEKNPDVVVCVGGDGTFLYAEKIYPEIPKLFIKHRCRGCKKHDYRDILKKLAAKNFKIKNYIKVRAAVNGKILVGLNEINVHYKLPHAIGLLVKVGNLTQNIFGDGLIVSTPYGSSGYFKSITGKTFKQGLGIAFNNPVEKTGPLYVDKNAVISVEVTRNSGFITADSSNEIIELKVGDKIEIKKHKKPARIILLAGEKLKVEI